MENFLFVWKYPLVVAEDLSVPVILCADFMSEMGLINDFQVRQFSCKFRPGIRIPLWIQVPDIVYAFDDPLIHLERVEEEYP